MYMFRILTVDAATVGIDLEPRRGDFPGGVIASSLQTDSKSPGGTPKSAYPNPFNKIRY